MPFGNQIKKKAGTYLVKNEGWSNQELTENPFASIILIQKS